MKTVLVLFALFFVRCAISEELTTEELIKRLDAARKWKTIEEKVRLYNAIIPFMPKASEEDFPEERRLLLRDAIIKDFEADSFSFYSYIPRVFKIEERFLLEKYVTNIDSPVHRAAVSSYVEVAGVLAVPQLLKLCQNPKVDSIPYAEYIQALSRFPCPEGLVATYDFAKQKKTLDYRYVYWYALACYPEPQAIKETNLLRISTDRILKLDWQTILRMRKDGKFVAPLQHVLANGPESWNETATEELKKLDAFNRWYKLVAAEMTLKLDDDRLPLVDALCTMDERSRSFLQSKLDASTDPKDKSFLERVLNQKK